MGMNAKTDRTQIGKDEMTCVLLLILLFHTRKLNNKGEIYVYC